jgi:steroid delta-isomerase-like uncharacterized protein
MRSLITIFASTVLLSLAATCAEADPAANTQTARRVFLEKMGEGRFDKLDQIYGPGFVAHGSSRDYTLEEDNESGKAWRAAFPDLKVSVERTVADDEFVAVHWSAAGTNTAAAAGTPGLGKKARVEGMTFFRFADGRIIEEWSIIDLAALNQQLM